MPEPTTTTAAAVATLSGGALAVPALSLLGMPLGLRADVLVAGFAGALAAVALLNSVPATGDTLRALIETSFKRLFVATTSSLFAGYMTPLLLFTGNLPDSLLLSAAFLAGGGAQKIFAAVLRKFFNDEPPKGGAA